MWRLVTFLVRKSDKWVSGHCPRVLRGSGSEECSKGWMTQDSALSQLSIARPGAGEVDGRYGWSEWGKPGRGYKRKKKKGWDEMRLGEGDWRNIFFGQVWQGSD